MRLTFGGARPSVYRMRDVWNGLEIGVGVVVAILLLPVAAVGGLVYWLVRPSAMRAFLDERAPEGWSSTNAK